VDKPAEIQQAQLDCKFGGIIHAAWGLVTVQCSDSRTGGNHSQTPLGGGKWPTAAMFGSPGMSIA
jgi:hypothetical protein